MIFLPKNDPRKGFEPRSDVNVGDITFKNSNEKADMNILSVDYFNMSLLKQHSILFSECAHTK